MDIPKIGQPTPKTHQIVFVVGCSSTIIYPILVALRVLPILKGHHLLVSAPLENMKVNWIIIPGTRKMNLKFETTSQFQNWWKQN